MEAQLGKNNVKILRGDGGSRKKFNPGGCILCVIVWCDVSDSKNSRNLMYDMSLCMYRELTRLRVGAIWAHGKS